ncbi:protein associated with UVRAG as autophagy enhancer [Halichoeres trimaculatus]|uniref:protein associated with UVRAG as autophagy enhancer n=1 Tax=Halichoeres trimaculatus TaxID=147232 RepID=UPI003D9EC0AD
MDDCSRDSSVSLRRQRYVSWCVDSADAPTGKISAGTTGELSQQPGPGSVPRILLTPPETRGRAPHHHPQTVLTKSTHEKAFMLSYHSDLESEVHSDDRGRKGDRNCQTPQEESPLILHRSSPVIRRHRPVSWHEGGADSSDSSSTGSSSPFPVSLSLKQHKLLKGSSLEDMGSSTSHTGCRPRTPGDARREKRSSFIPEYSADIFRTRCELEQENAHFIVVDMVLEVLEGVKWTLMMDAYKHNSTAGGGASQQHKHRNASLEHHKERNSNGDVQTSLSNTHSCCTPDEDNGEEVRDDDHQKKTFSVLSCDSGFEECVMDLTQTPKEALRNAEDLAQQLVLEFRRGWLPSDEPRRGRLSLRSSLRELPGTAGVSVSSRGSLKEEIRLRTRMRGTLSWTPPQVELIFDVQPNHRRCDVIALQNFLCAGCGTEFDHKHIKKLRYCEYLGRYFCDCCHSGSEAVIPARVLNCWDFNKFPVSHFSKQLLDSVWFQPLFDLSYVGKTLNTRVKELHRFRELQDQLLGIKRLLKACRLSAQVMSEFEQLPAHLTEQPHLFSMDDLLRVKKGRLVAQARAVLNSTVSHVENCELCLARGFICEFCREKDVIFPFQTDICKRCPDCRTCFHKQCFVEKECPKCARIRSWRK